MKIELKGKRALVTGGSSGIGAAIGQALAAAGAEVALSYRSHPDEAAALVRGIRRKRGKAMALQADVSNPAAVAAMFGHLDKAWKGVDILVNCAGMDGQKMLAWEADHGAWARVLEVNLFGAFYCASEALKRMIKRRRGVILNISSVHEVIPWTGYSAYTASKAALSMLTKTLAQEAAPHGVRVLAIAPGAIKTPINQNVWGNKAGLKDLLTKIPLGRIGETDDIADMAVVLVSDVAGYVTGTSIFIDGGMTDYPGFAEGG